MATVRHVELPDGSIYTISDWGDYPLYSRCQIAAARAQDVTVFGFVASQVIPGGGAVAQATVLDTNMTAAGQLPLRHQMVIFSVQIRFDEADSDAVGAVTQCNSPAEGMVKWNNVTQNTYFQLLIENTKPYVEGPICSFPCGGGLYWQQTEHWDALATPSPEPDIWSAYNPNNGEPGAHAARRLAMPIHLGALEPLSGVFKFPRGALPVGGIAPDIDVGMTVTLTGPRQRPIG